eukprot:scaffold5075_cov109-Isochrysis_galbana.AAC.7
MLREAGEREIRGWQRSSESGSGVYGRRQRACADPTRARPKARHCSPPAILQKASRTVLEPPTHHLRTYPNPNVWPRGRFFRCATSHCRRPSGVCTRPPAAASHPTRPPNKGRRVVIRGLEHAVLPPTCGCNDLYSGEAMPHAPPSA